MLRYFIKHKRTGNYFFSFVEKTDHNNDNTFRYIIPVHTHKEWSINRDGLQDILRSFFNDDRDGYYTRYINFNESTSDLPSFDPDSKSIIWHKSFEHFLNEYEITAEDSHEPDNIYDGHDLGVKTINEALQSSLWLFSQNISRFKLNEKNLTIGRIFSNSFVSALIERYSDCYAIASYSTYNKKEIADFLTSVGVRDDVVFSRSFDIIKIKNKEALDTINLLKDQTLRINPIEVSWLVETDKNSDQYVTHIKSLIDKHYDWEVK